MATKYKTPFKDRDAQLFIFSKHPFYLFLFLVTWFLLLFYCLPAKKTATLRISGSDDQKLTTASRRCTAGALVYVYELPEKFNAGLLEDCRNLSVYTDMCPHVANRGLGQPVPEMGSPSWYATHQFIAEMIFHARAENHPCRTWDPQEAALFYVPFYGGLHASSKFREPDLQARDALAVQLVEYLSQQPAWQRNQGADHFLALGRTAWDFMRSEDGVDFGANRLLRLPRVLNMSVLTVERHPWEGSNQHGIPYASYFHPSTLDEMVTWQERMRSSPRPFLFSFVAGPRKGVDKAAVRDVIFRHCAESTQCHHVKCSPGAPECHEPNRVLGVLSRSIFCMQPPGDSFTRRSVFDSVLAGCIPVFFSPHTAYTQYEWYLPSDHEEYSVYIAEEKAGQIEEELLKIPADKVERMRATVIDLIPRLTYAHPNTTDAWLLDAVDVALERLAKHVRSRF
ncbi:probable xyloglucan galactosyltransferase GT17 [Magnolia sinica]|uniref:probable xyloglucan galactosyltransferase GT17 n=1 Tax=Magnolia sinica TaxID=86752 RepID=UPI00265ACCE0|nr:probable xyloglucan galactosyltransferase GT17 [Magnolia sinica]